MESSYHRHNPYHNSVHAADVTQAMHCFLRENKFAEHLTPLETMSSVIAAVAHDLDHPGVTQAFLVATSNHLVNLYQNSSVLENHHWRTAISCLSESGIFDHLERETWSDIQAQIRSLILATDITRQREFLARFKNYLQSECLDMEQPQYRHFALQIALKCADLCNPCRPWPISQRWSYQVCQEFYRQGAYERQLKLPVTPTFDCSRTKVAKIQADFFQFVVSPLFETWDHFLNTSLSRQLLRNLRHNYTQWQKKMEAIQRISEAEAAAQRNSAPIIQVETCSASTEVLPSPSEGEADEDLLTAESDIVLKQHRSRSDSGLSPRLLSPRFHLETYSTEELHPSTTLLSLSSITNTVQLRQVYATTKVESHLICPTVFQPLLLSDEPMKVPSTISAAEQSGFSLTVTDPCQESETAQCTTMPSCPDGCCSPATPENCVSLKIHQPLVNKSDTITSYFQTPSGRRASDFTPKVTVEATVTRCQSQDLVSLSTSQQLFDSDKDCSSDRMHRDESSTQWLTTGKSGFLSSGNPELPSRKFHSEENTYNPESADTSQTTPSWCWHISRSFSAERPQRPTHDFDSPLPSTPISTAHGNLTCYSAHGTRRGSAPVEITITSEIGGSQFSSLGDIDAKDGLRGGAEDGPYARRWSIPMETITGIQMRNNAPNTSESLHIADATIRGHSFGPFDPFLAMSALEADNGMRPNFCNIKPSGCGMFSTAESQDLELNDPQDSQSGSSLDPFLPCFSPKKIPVPRRGSLPAEVPIALMCHVSSPSRHLHKSIRSDSLSSSKEPPRSQCFSGSQSSQLWEHSKRNGSSADLLSVLIGPTGMLNTMHGIVSGRTRREWAGIAAHETSRRRSGGLEMLSGLWKSRTSETPIGIEMAAKIKLQRQLLDEWASWRKGEDNRVGASASISALSQQLVYQHRRGSVPLNTSLLSLSSGNTGTSEHVN